MKVVQGYLLWTFKHRPMYQSFSKLKWTHQSGLIHVLCDAFIDNNQASKLLVLTLFSIQS